MCCWDLSAAWSRPLSALRPWRCETSGPIFTWNLTRSQSYNEMLFPLQWLNEEKLAQRLIELIHPERDDEVKRSFQPFSDWWETQIRAANGSRSASNRHFPWLSFLWLCFCVAEAVQRFPDSVWHHSSEQRPGQSAPGAFPAGPPVGCAGVVSQRWLLQARFRAPPPPPPPLSVVTVRCSFIILQAGVCGTAAAEYVFNGGYWQLYSQRDPGSSHLTGNKTTCVSDYFEVSL